MFEGFDGIFAGGFESGVKTKNDANGYGGDESDE